MLSRRHAFVRLFAALAGGLAAGGVAAATTERRKVAYHLDDLDKVNFALGNIRNHIDGEGGPAAVDIVLVVNGPALGAFRKERADEPLRQKLAAIAGDGVMLGACGNTLDAQQIAVTDLVQGFIRVDEGGVVRLARLQAEGYAYIRP